MSVDENPTREDVLALYGEALLAAQELEEAMVALLGGRAELSVIAHRNFDLSSEDVDELERFWGRPLCTPGRAAPQRVEAL